LGAQVLPSGILQALLLDIEVTLQRVQKQSQRINIYSLDWVRAFSVAILYLHAKD
jgi:hypothetical protein